MNIVIMTAPPRNPLPLIQSLDGGPGIYTVCDTERRGTLSAVTKCLETGLLAYGPVTILQDDIIVCQDFVRYVERLLPVIEKTQSIVKWFDVDDIPVADYMERPRFRKRTPERFEYIQAVTYSRRWAEQILKYLQAIPSESLQCDDRGQYHGDDMYICEALRAYKQPFYVHSPSIVQHIGRDSLVAPGMPLDIAHRRVSQTFVGLDFDVLSWPTLTLPE